MSTDKTTAPPSWTSFTNVDRPSLTESPPTAFRKPPFFLKASIAVYLFALVAMVVAIAILKAPGS